MATFLFLCCLFRLLAPGAGYSPMPKSEKSGYKREKIKEVVERALDQEIKDALQIDSQKEQAFCMLA